VPGGEGEGGEMFPDVGGSGRCHAAIIRRGGR
jgi:hypothetical protein